MPADKSNGSLTDQSRGAASIEQRCASHGSTRNDERYHPAPRNDTQPSFEGAGMPGEDVAIEARKWIAEHPDEWEYMIRQARVCAAKRGWVPIKLIIEQTRFNYSVGIKNALSPALARLMMGECPDLDGKFRVHAASCDGWTL